MPDCPPLSCSTCGAIDTPRIEPGTGPHAARAACAHCGRFLKWLPKVFIERKMGMHPSINKCILLGQVGKQGVEVRYNPSGAACASFTLVLTEVGTDGKEHATWQPCEIWGRKAEQVGELDAGTLVLLEGRLRRQKKAESWETIVSGWECTPLTLPAHVGATAEGSNN